MAKVKDIDAPFRKNERVLATTDLPNVPLGTEGKVKMLAGFHRAGSWRRYWVFFDNGEQLGSIDSSKLVRVGDWPAWQERARQREAEGAEVAAKADAAKKAAAKADEGEAPANSRIPAALLERAKKRKEALGKA